LASALTGDWRTADPLIAAGIVDGADDEDRRIVERASVELITGRDARRRTDPANRDVALTTGTPAIASGAEGSSPDPNGPSAAALGATLVRGAETVDPLITRRSADAVCPLAAVAATADVDDAWVAMRIT
jgi:hypothetical protein